MSGSFLPGMHRQLMLLSTRLAKAEQELASMRQQRFPTLDHARDVRWVQTMVGDSAYPDGELANTLPIRFLDPEFEASQGQQLFTTLPRSDEAKTFAHAATANWMPPGMKVPAMFQPGLGAADAGKWFFIDGPKTYMAVLEEDLLPDDVALASIWMINALGAWADTGYDVPVRDFFLLASGASEPLPATTPIYVTWSAKLGGDGQFVAISTVAGTGAQVAHFELAEPLTFGGHARAKLLTFDPVDKLWEESGVEIEICDWYTTPGMWRGETGYRGLALRRPGDFVDEGEDPESPGDDVTRPEFDVIWMEQMAAWIKGVATEDMSAVLPNQLTLSVSHYDHQGKNPGTTVQVFDDDEVWTDIVNGSEIDALYDYADGKYRIIRGQRLATHAFCNLDGALCGDSSAVLDTATFAIIPHGEHCLAPASEPAIADNGGQQAGLDGDKVLLVRTSLTEWTIMRAVWRSTQVVTDVQVSGLTLQKKTRTIYMQICDATDPIWSTFHTGTDECPE